MSTRLLVSSLWLAAVQAQQILPVTQTVQFTSAAIATGVSSATLVPFNVDFTNQPDYRNYNLVQEYSTSVWESRVAIYDDSESFSSFLSLLWPIGQGPGARPVAANKTWNGCIISIPELFDRVGATGHGNGSCFDVVDNDCLSNIMSYAAASWETALGQESSLTPAALARACSGIDSLPLTPGCFGKSSRDVSSVKAYPNLNPSNGQPFMVGLDEYKSAMDKKADIQAKAVSRAWPVLILEAEQKVVVTAVMSCPSAGTGYFSDGFDRGNLNGWTVYGGAFDASSKALVGKSSGGGKAMIKDMTFGDFAFEADIAFPAGADSGNSGLVFRVSDPADGADSYRGYYAGLEVGTNSLVLGRANNNWNEIGRARADVRAGQTNHIKVRAEGDSIFVYVDDMDKPKITVKDNTYSSGLSSVRVYFADTTFDNVSIKPLPPKDSVPSPDGTCGGPSRYKCTDTKVFYGNCCGAHGFCGYSASECSILCQSEYGLCDTVVTVTRSSTSPSPTPTNNGIFDDFSRKDMSGWKIADGNFDASSGEMVIARANSAKSIIDKSFDNFVLEADIALTVNEGNGGFIFRASNLTPGEDAYNGYYVGLNSGGWIDLGRANGHWTPIKSAKYNIVIGQKYHTRVRAVGDLIEVYVADMATPAISVRDATLTKGATGVRVWHTGMKVDNFKVQSS